MTPTSKWLLKKKAERIKSQTFNVNLANTKYIVMKLTSKTCYILSFCLLLFLGCKKATEPSPEPYTPKKLLSRIIQVDNDSKTTFKTFEYDDKQRLKSINNGTTLDEYRYEGNNLVSTTFWTGLTKSEYTITYRDGKPDKAVRKVYELGKLISESTNGYIYANGNDPSEIHSTEAGIVRATMKLQYSANHNITRQEQQANILIIYENTYDTKPNIFTNSMLGFYFPGENYDRLSGNNLIKSKIIYTDGTYLEITNTYTYDDDGFPFTRVYKAQHSSGGAPTTYKYTYEYVIQ